MGLLDVPPRRRPHDTGFATGSTTTNSSVTAQADHQGGDAGTGTGAPPAMTAARASRTVATAPAAAVQAAGTDRAPVP